MSNTDLIYANKTKNQNEITSLISLIEEFVRIIKTTLLSIRTNFRDIVFLSNHLSESSETIVHHVQKQSDYLEEINLQMAVFLENIKNSEISFKNLREIIEDSSAKINNLNLDVVFISYEVLSLKELNNKNMKNKMEARKILMESIVSLEDEEHSSSETSKTLIKNMEFIISLIDKELEMLKEKDVKLSNLSKTALTIKRDAEINNANLSDILGVITILGFETKDIRKEINTTIEESTVLINVSKDMVEKSKFVSSDVTILNKYIVNLDKEFNKFLF